MKPKKETQENGSENPEQISPESVELIASVCLAANAAYCRSLGDESQPEWAFAQDWHRESATKGVRFHLANPDAGDSARHDIWMAKMIADGWVFGEVNDPEKKTHPRIVPFEELPKEEQFKDTLFRTLVHALEPRLAAAAGNFTDLEQELTSARAALEGANELHVAAVKERDILANKLAKLEAEPKTRRAAASAKVRKCGPVDEQPSPADLLELIGAAETVEVVFSDGKTEIPFSPILVSGKAWGMTAVGLVLRVPDLIVTSPASGPVTLGGYGLYLDGKQVAFAARSEPLEVQPGRRMDLRNDVVFTAH